MRIHSAQCYAVSRAQHGTGFVSGCRRHPKRGGSGFPTLTACIASRAKDGEIHLPEPLSALQEAPGHVHNVAGKGPTQCEGFEVD